MIIIKNMIIHNKKKAFNEMNKEKNISNNIMIIIKKIIIDYKDLTISKGIINSIKIIKIILFMNPIK